VYENLSDDEKHVIALEEGSERRIDHEFYIRPVSELEEMISSTRDLSHYPYQHAVVLHDPSGEMTRIISKLARLPRSIRDVRMRVHFLEFSLALRRSRKAIKRGGKLNVQLLYCQAFTALVKLLFLVMGSWPAGHHWSEQELSIVGVDPAFISCLGRLASCPTEENMTTLEARVRTWLVEKKQLLTDIEEETFQDTYRNLVSWAYSTPDGKKAFEAWSFR